MLISDVRVDFMRRGAYTLSELTELADVSARTVRYYIAEGLLPPPDSAGARAFYSQGHLDRLLLIGRLKEEYLPLREIRRRLDDMTEAEIAAEIRNSIQDISDPETAMGSLMLEERDDASGYLHRVLGLSGAESADQALIPEADQAAQDIRNIGAASAPVRSFSSPQRRGRDGEWERDRRDARALDEAGSRWRRIELGPDAELLIREDALERDRSRVEWLINWAQRVFR